MTSSTPFHGTITLQYLDGEPQMESFTANDVDGDFITFDSTGLTFMQTKKRGVIADMSLIAAGAITSKLRLYLNGKDTGNTYLDTGVVSTVNNRVPVPYPVDVFVQIQIKQLA